MQTERVPLPTGDDGKEHWADIRLVADLRSGDRKAVKRVMQVSVDEAGNSSLNVGMTDDMHDALLTRVITAWSFDMPLPIASTNSLDDLPLAAYDALVEATKEHFAAVDFRKGAAPTVPKPATSSG